MFVMTINVIMYAKPFAQYLKYRKCSVILCWLLSDLKSYHSSDIYLLYWSRCMYVKGSNYYFKSWRFRAERKYRDGSKITEISSTHVFPYNEEMGGSENCNSSDNLLRVFCMSNPLIYTISFKLRNNLVSDIDTTVTILEKTKCQRLRNVFKVVTVSN